MQTICLITPPSCFLLDERVLITLGILRVGACLELAGYRVDHLDLSGVGNYEEVVRTYTQSSKVLAYGVTATTPQMPAVTRVAEIIRESTLSRLILGGPHPTLVNAAYRREIKLGQQGRAARAMNGLLEAFDVVVAGDGEDAIFEAIKPGAHGLIDADDPKGKLFLTNARLNELPLPARHLVDAESYRFTIEGQKAYSMIAQLGCPFACAFCGGRESPMLRRIRTRTTESVVKEVIHLHETYGAQGVMFYDDELNVNKSVVSLMDSIASLGLDLRLRGFVKAELFTDEQAAAMHRAGFRWLLVGFESGSPRILENINKKATREDNTRCLQIAHKHGIKVKALMSLGHAGESAETIQQTKDWLLEQRPDDFDATVITTYPGTPYFDHALETSKGIWTFTAPSGDKLHAYETDFARDASYYKGAPGDYKSFVFTDYLSAEDIVRLRDELEADVRRELNVPFNAGAPGVRYEASMGQLPGHILRTT